MINRKYRIWEKEYKKLFYPDYIIIHPQRNIAYGHFHEPVNTGSIYYKSDYDDECSGDGDASEIAKYCIPVPLGDVMESTGMQDVEGKDIYEGDILRGLRSTSCDFDTVSEVRSGNFEFCNPGLEFTKHLGFYLFPGERLLSCDELERWQYKVVGNVYQGQNQNEE